MFVYQGSNICVFALFLDLKKTFSLSLSLSLRRSKIHRKIALSVTQLRSNKKMEQRGGCGSLGYVVTPTTSQWPTNSVALTCIPSYASRYTLSLKKKKKRRRRRRNTDKSAPRLLIIGSLSLSILKSFHRHPFDQTFSWFPNFEESHATLRSHECSAILVVIIVIIASENIDVAYAIDNICRTGIMLRMRLGKGKYKLISDRVLPI